MERDNLIFTGSGIRGIAEKELNFNTAKKIAIAYGLWLNPKDKRIIIGRDTRPSGTVIEKGIVEGLVTMGFKIIYLGVCPTPVVIYTKNKCNIPGTIIITGSHNPQEWNGLKLLSTNTFLSKDEMSKISRTIDQIDLNAYSSNKNSLKNHVKPYNPLPSYIKDLTNYVDLKQVKKKNDLKVIIDTGAGAGKYGAPQILRELGCNLKLINNEMLVKGTFPREIEPIESNLTDLIMEVWQNKFDIGFAYDSDADRIAIIGENAVCYPEDIGIALITENYLKHSLESDKEMIFVTNLASSLRFEVLAEKYNAHVIRTPVGERFLVEKIYSLVEEDASRICKRLIFGGEGSCGGFIYPYFNNTRDGIFAAAKIIEILVQSGKKVSELVSTLPKYYTHREKINVNNRDLEQIISMLKRELEQEGEKVEQINLDLRWGEHKDWFILIHPSNTESVLRVISEAKRKSLARIYCEATAELVKLIISRF
ncbi:MAG: hypothetical protein ACXAAI_00590 [Promethearchaeota archaeon]|jgi:phosphomannomutase/phosphoglucomutase